MSTIAIDSAISMDSSIPQMIQEIFEIMSNPDSYTTKHTTSTSSIESIIHNFFKNQTSNFDKIESKHMPFVIDMLKKIMPTELKIDYSDLYDYFVKVEQMQSNPVCSCYLRNHDELEQYSDDDVVKSSELFMGFHCKSCGHFESEHKPCAKYVKTDDYCCDTCGLGKSQHTICTSYVGVVDDCTNCGFSWHNHQDLLDSMKVNDCGKFTPHVEYSYRCAGCIFNDTHHKYSTKFHHLNDDAKSKVADLFFELSADFISLTETERMKFYTEYYMVTRIITKCL